VVKKQNDTLNHDGIIMHARTHALPSYLCNQTHHQYFLFLSIDWYVSPTGKGN
jgi:hypothetical protein